MFGDWSQNFQPHLQGASELNNVIVCIVLTSVYIPKQLVYSYELEQCTRKISLNVHREKINILQVYKNDFYNYDFSHAIGLQVRSLISMCYKTTVFEACVAKLASDL